MNNQPNTDTDLMNDKLVTMAFMDLPLYFQTPVIT